MQAVRRQAQWCRSCRGQRAVGSGTALLVDGGFGTSPTRPGGQSSLSTSSSSTSSPLRVHTARQRGLEVRGAEAHGRCGVWASARAVRRAALGLGAPIGRSASSVGSASASATEGAALPPVSAPDRRPAAAAVQRCNLIAASQTEAVDGTHSQALDGMPRAAAQLGRRHHPNGAAAWCR